MDIFGWATGGVDGKYRVRLLENARHRVNGVFLEEDEFAGTENARLGAFNINLGAAGEHIEILIGTGVIVRRHSAVDAKDAAAGVALIGQT